MKGSPFPHLLSELTLKVAAEQVSVRCRSLPKPWTKQGLGFRLTLHFRGWREGTPGPCKLEESGIIKHCFMRKIYGIQSHLGIIQQDVLSTLPRYSVQLGMESLCCSAWSSQAQHGQVVGGREVPKAGMWLIPMD